MTETEDLICRINKATGTNRDLDEEIAEALGGNVIRVGRLGINGRSPGSMRVFWPNKPYNRKGSAIPYYTKTEESRAKAIARIQAYKSDQHEG